MNTEASAWMVYLFVLGSTNNENACLFQNKKKKKKLSDEVGATCDVKGRRFPAAFETKLQIPRVHEAR